MSFRIGQKIVCVKDFIRMTGNLDGTNLRPSKWWNWFPFKGEVYTVSRLVARGHPMLEESPDHCSFDKSKFRSLSDYQFVEDVIRKVSENLDVEVGQPNHLN